MIGVYAETSIRNYFSFIRASGVRRRRSIEVLPIRATSPLRQVDGSGTSTTRYPRWKPIYIARYAHATLYIMDRTKVVLKLCNQRIA